MSLPTELWGPANPPNRSLFLCPFKSCHRKKWTFGEGHLEPLPLWEILQRAFWVVKKDLLALFSPRILSRALELGSINSYNHSGITPVGHREADDVSHLCTWGNKPALQGLDPKSMSQHVFHAPRGGRKGHAQGFTVSLILIIRAQPWTKYFCTLKSEWTAFFYVRVSKTLESTWQSKACRGRKKQLICLLAARLS